MRIMDMTEVGKGWIDRSAWDVLRACWKSVKFAQVELFGADEKALT